VPARERILDTATRLFYYQGIPATGVDNVIASAGVAKMSLYRHFGSKERLIVECLERLDVRYHEWFVAQVEDQGGDPASKLLSVFDVLDEWFASGHFRGCAFINATVELADRGHPARTPAMRHKERNRAYVQELAEAAGVPDPVGLSKQIMLLVEGAIVTALVQDDLTAAANARLAAQTLVGHALSQS
jgi:AcrR family transcriptional regulator